MKVVYFCITVFALDYDDKSMHDGNQMMDFDNKHKGFKVRVLIQTFSLVDCRSLQLSRKKLGLSCVVKNLQNLILNTLDSDRTL